MADNRDFDFQIGDLCFRGATSDRFPYVRATAPFRKEQFDSSGRAGDQSLTGWWTRGQLSFHKGAGLNFYEVQAGNEVFDRFDISEGIDAWTPGQVALAGDTADHPTATAPATVYSAAFQAGDLYAVSAYNGGTVYRDGVALTTASGSAPQCVAATTHLGGRIIVGVDRDIEVTSGSTLSNLWTNDDMVLGVNYTHLFWAKDRIWAVTSQGVWYVLDHAGGTVASGGPERFWDNDLSFNWSLADTPGGVYISRDQYIWLVTVDPDTAELSTPRLVADLGEGASIVSIAHNRGLLGICTERGFLVGAIRDSGDLTLGPTFLRYGASFCHNIVSSGSSFFFLAVHEDDLDFSGGENHSLYEVNLTEEVTSLQYPWVIRDRRVVDGQEVWCFPTITSSICVMVASDRTTVPEAGIVGPYVGEQYRASGTLTTAFHRFGTLDDKAFRQLLVRARGTGTIDAYLIRKYSNNGIESTGVVHLGQMEAGDLEHRFDIEGYGPMEAMAFMFILRVTNSNLASPVLLGYQVKALPVPERQRILRWPLLLHDVVRLRRGAEVGTQGKALTDLQALEALESTSAVVTYTDHRTGETGSAYIDSIEFQSDTPSSKTTNGFGGIAYVSLRVIG